MISFFLWFFIFYFWRELGRSRRKGETRKQQTDGLKDYVHRGNPIYPGFGGVGERTFCTIPKDRQVYQGNYISVTKQVFLSVSHVCRSS